jgi:hypothetical protein
LNTEELRLVVLPDGNVGIGTATPGYLLTLHKNYNGATTWAAFNTSDGTAAQVGGGVSRTTDWSSKYLTWGVTAPSYAGAGYGETAYFHSRGVPLKYGTLDANNIYLFTNGIANTRMTILSTGNVGIGTTNPGVRFDVLGTHVSGIGVARFKGDADSGFIALDTTTAGEAGYLVHSAGTLIGQFGVRKSDNVVYIKNRVYGTDDVVSISSTGRVGIGTTNPLFKLQTHADGASVQGAYSAYSNTATDHPMWYVLRGRGTWASPLGVQAGDDLGRIRFAGQKSTTVGDFTTGAYIGAIASTNFGATVSSTHLVFGTTPSGTALPVEVARITDSGRFGHGTTAPNAHFHTHKTDTTNTNIFEASSTSAGTQMWINDELGKYMVNDVSGLPILEVTPDWVFTIWDYPGKLLDTQNSRINILKDLMMNSSYSRRYPEVQ